MLLSTAMLCLAANIYHEARGENLMGQHAVALVTMNRAHDDANQVCDVVMKDKQFSWTNGQLVKRKWGRFYLTKKGEPKDERAWRQAKGVAYVVMKGWVPDYTRGATFYHAKRVNPRWNKDMKLVAVFGNHKFYVKA